MSQLQLFDYSTLPAELQVEVKTATERIKLRMKRTAEDIIEIGKDLIAIKEKLPHGRFLPWIASEFEMSQPLAYNFMQVAKRFGSENYNNYNFSPTVLFLLSAPATPDEVVEQVIEKAENGETVSVQAVKELKAQLQEKDRLISQFEMETQLFQKQLENVNKSIPIRVQTEAKEMAEELAANLVEEIEADYQSRITQLEKDQLTLMDKLADAEESYHSAIESFKLNPDPETKAKKEQLAKELKQAEEDVKRVKYKLENLTETHNQAFSASFTVERFFKDLDKVVKNHPEALTSMASPYLPDSSLARLETIAATFETWAETIYASVSEARSGKANTAVSFNQILEIEATEVN